MKLIKDQLLEAQKLEEEARREDNTILISSLPLSANEKEIYKFFSKCGKIRDVYIIRDQRSGKSKGIAYVEFYYPDSILAACSTQNKDFMGNSIHIQPSHAEKNRVAQAARNLKQKALIPIPQMTNAATNAKRIYISGLTDTLADISENMLKNVFNAFGDIELVDIHRDPFSGKCKGYAFIQYIKSDDAKAAINKMNGYIIAGKPIKVTPVTQELSALCDANAVDLDDSSANNYIHTPQSRALLIQKLSRTDNTFAAGILAAPGHPDHLQNPEMISIINAIMNEPTRCIFLAGMYDLKEVEDDDFYDELRAEIKGECSTYGKVIDVFIDNCCEINAFILFHELDDAETAYDR